MADFPSALETVAVRCPANERRSAPPVTQAPLPAPLDKLPADIQTLRRWAMAQPAYDDAGQNEREWSDEAVACMYVNKGKPDYLLGDIPLIVLTRTKGGYGDGLGIPAEELNKERLALQADLARLSSNSLHIIAPDSGHNIHLEAPALVIDAIQRVVIAARHRTRLGQTQVMEGRPSRKR
jgi:pimeloyl-ACP methyl ester carboxylesterase